MIDHLNKQAQVIRRVSVSPQRVVTVADVSEPTFRVAVSAPAESPGGVVDRSPRENPPYMVRWRGGLYGPTSNPQAGARLDLDGTSYEVLAGPLELYHGSRVVGYEVPVMPVSQLYPYEGSFIQQDGTTLIALLSFALWEPADNHTERGEYMNFEGEAPPEYAANFARNHALVIGAERHVLTSVLVDASGPRVRFSARMSLRG